MTKDGEARKCIENRKSEKKSGEADNEITNQCRESRMLEPDEHLVPGDSPSFEINKSKRVQSRYLENLDATFSALCHSHKIRKLSEVISKAVIISEEKYRANVTH